MWKDNSQRKWGELILLRKQDSNSCFKSGDTRFSIVQAHSPNISVKTTRCGGFLLSKNNVKPNSCPITDQKIQRSDLRKLC